MHESILTLYSYRRCPFAIRVRMVLHEKSLNFVTKEEDLKNFSMELKSLHPDVKVPLLLHGDLVVYESAVITEYLDETFPQNPLMPIASKERAQVRLWTHWCNSRFKPHIDHFKYGKSEMLVAPRENSISNLMSDLEKLETALSLNQWLVGNSFTLADIHVFPFYRQLSKTTPPFVGLESFALTRQWFDRICERDAFEKSMHKG